MLLRFHLAPGLQFVMDQPLPKKDPKPLDSVSWWDNPSVIPKLDLAIYQVARLSRLQFMMKSAQLQCEETVEEKNTSVKFRWRMFAKSLEKSIFLIIKIAQFEISHSDNSRLIYDFRQMGLTHLKWVIFKMSQSRPSKVTHDSKRTMSVSRPTVIHGPWKHFIP